MTTFDFDACVVGAGAVGLACGYALAQRGLSVLVLEKERAIGQGVSSRNSEVVHAGLYYPTGSLKARLCVAGAREMVEFCARHGIPHEVCGKLIVATTAAEDSRLDDLRARGEANGLTGLEMLEGAAMRAIEPHVGGLRALKVPATGITDYSLVTAKYAEIAAARGVEVRTCAGVTGFGQTASEVVVQTRAGEFATRYVVNCAGLYSDRIARLASHDPGMMLVPFRGEYYDLAPARANLVRALIYPVPDPAYPFLGVHFTRRIAGNVDAGPNAVLAGRREGYRRTDFDLDETMQVIRYAGFRAMALRHWKNGIGEMWRSWSKREFVRSCQTLVPEVKMEDMTPGGSGVRAQAVADDGTLVDDFRFVARDRFLHVLNVPSPAATASLPIGREIVQMAKKMIE